MKKIKENKWLYTLVFAIATSIMGIILYPLFDYLLCKFITNSEFIYSVHQHIFQPILFGFIIAIVLYAPIFHKNKENSK